MSFRIGKPSRRRPHFLGDWRRFRGFTQQGLADELGTTKATVSRIENGKLPYTQDFLEACADVLGAHPGTLLIRKPAQADREAVAFPQPSTTRGKATWPASRKLS